MRARARLAAQVVAGGAHAQVVRAVAAEPRPPTRPLRSIYGWNRNGLAPARVATARVRLRNAGPADFKGLRLPDLHHGHALLLRARPTTTSGSRRPPRSAAAGTRVAVIARIRRSYNLFGTEQAKLHALDAAQRRRRRRKGLLHGGGSGSGGPQAAASLAAGAEVGSAARAPLAACGVPAPAQSPCNNLVCSLVTPLLTPYLAACMRGARPAYGRVRMCPAKARWPLSAPPSSECARSPARIPCHPHTTTRTVDGRPPLCGVERPRCGYAPGRGVYA